MSVSGRPNKENYKDEQVADSRLDCEEPVDKEVPVGDNFDEPRSARAGNREEYGDTKVCILI